MGVTDDFKPMPDLSYMTAGEANAFRKQRASGQLTWWRTAPCVQCGAETIKHKQFCSKSCYEKAVNGDGQSDETNTDGQVD